MDVAASPPEESEIDRLIRESRAMQKELEVSIMRTEIRRMEEKEKFYNCMMKISELKEPAKKIVSQERKNG